MSVYKAVIYELEGIADKKFKEFSERIINGEKPLLGVKIPKLREIAKRTPVQYLSECEFKYFEDTLIYGLITASLPYEEFLSKLKLYLSKADSWAHIDSFTSSIKCVKKNRAEFLEYIKSNVSGSEGLKLRFYIVALMDFYLDRENLGYVFSVVEKSDGKGFYTDMAIAWLVSVAFVKFKAETYEFLKKGTLTKFTLNKSVSKICDSFRVSEEDKEKIKKMRKT